MMSFNRTVCLLFFLAAMSALRAQTNTIDIGSQSPYYVSQRIQLSHHPGTAYQQPRSVGKESVVRDLPLDVRIIDSDLNFDPSGKRLSYIISIGERTGSSVSLRVVSVPDGKTAVVQKGKIRSGDEVRESVPQRNCYWSTDGEHLIYTTVTDQFQNDKDRSIVYNTFIYSIKQGTTKLVDDTAQWADPIWINASLVVFRRVGVPAETSESNRSTICSYDLKAGSQTTICEFQGRPLGYDTETRHTILESDDAVPWTVPISGGEPSKANHESIQQVLKRLGLPANSLISHDGVWQIVSEQPDVAAAAADSVDRINITNNKRSRFISWSPRTSWLLFCRIDKILDDSGEIGEEYCSLWAAPVPNVDREKAGKPRQLLICSNADIQPQPVWSPDGGKIAYSSGGDIFLAVIASDNAQVMDDPARSSALKAGQDIAEAFRKYLIHSNRQFPPLEYYDRELLPYLGDGKALEQPGRSGTSAFTYLRPYQTQDEIREPAQVVLGYLDYGLGWRINIYADGHVELEES